MEPFGLLFGRRNLSGSLIGSIAQTQEMLDFCGRHGLTADIELLPAERVNEGLDRLARGEVKYRFVLDTASLRG